MLSDGAFDVIDYLLESENCELLRLLQYVKLLEESLLVIVPDRLLLRRCRQVRFACKIFCQLSRIRVEHEHRLADEKNFLSPRFREVVRKHLIVDLVMPKLEIHAWF